MKVFVAGATGVIGRRVVPLLLKSGHEVTAVARSAEKRGALEKVGATAIEVDLFDSLALRSSVKGHDVVINLATSIPPSSKALFPWAWGANSRLRRHSSANLAEAARLSGAQRFIQESFAPIYPGSGSEWIYETSPLKPARYNRAVVDAESAAARFARSGGVGIALRFAYFYGADSDFTLDAIRMVRKGWAPTLGSPDGYISSISHDDAATAVIALLDAPSGVYNVTDDEPLTKREFVTAMASALHVRPPRFLPSWLWHFLGSVGETLRRSQRISNRKLRGTGWQLIHRSARDGLPAIIATVAH